MKKKVTITYIFVAFVVYYKCAPVMDTYEKYRTFENIWLGKKRTVTLRLFKFLQYLLSDLLLGPNKKNSVLSFPSTPICPSNLSKIRHLFSPCKINNKIKSFSDQTFLVMRWTTTRLFHFGLKIFKSSIVKSKASMYCTHCSAMKSTFEGQDWQWRRTGSLVHYTRLQFLLARSYPTPLLTLKNQWYLRNKYIV